MDDLTDRQFWTLVAAELDWRQLATLDPPDPDDVTRMLVRLVPDPPSRVLPFRRRIR